MFYLRLIPVKPTMQPLFSAALGIAALGTLFCLACAVCFFETPPVQLALALGALLLLPALSLLWSVARLKYLTLLSLACVVLTIFRGVMALLTVVSTSHHQDTHLSSHFVDSPRLGTRLVSFIPELDQVKLGLFLLPAFDPQMSRQRAAAVAGAVMEYYRAMQHDPEFADLPSAMGEAYANLFFHDAPSRHYYLYRPHTAQTTPLPALIFLHGAGGNFQAYLWAWKELADRYDLVLIAPSFGYGHWWQEGGDTVVRDILQDAQRFAALDPTRLYLAGLSNGGIGVLRSVPRLPPLAGIILLSPVLPLTLVRETASQLAAASTPLLIFSGRDDHNVSYQSVESAFQEWRARGVAVQLLPYENEDHFLFFTRKEAILTQIELYLTKTARSANDQPLRAPLPLSPSNRTELSLPVAH